MKMQLFIPPQSKEMNPKVFRRLAGVGGSTDPPKNSSQVMTGSSKSSSSHVFRFYSFSMVSS